MSETKEKFRIDKPGAYKLRGGGIADILGVDDKSAFGWCRADKNPGPMRQWARKDGLAWAATPMMDIIEAIPFVVDGPGRYMMRDGRVAIVDQMNRQNSVSGQRIGGWYKSTADSQKTDTSWHVDGAWYTIKGIDNNRDLVRKMHPLEQEPGAKASEEQKAPEIKKEPKKPTVAITHLGKYRARNGFFVDITHIGQETAIGVFYNQDAEPFAWLRDGRFNEHCESDEDIVEKIEQREETKTLDPVAKWSEEAMQHIEEYVGIMKKEGKPMDPLIEEALRVFRPDLCPPKAGQEKSGAEVLDALGKVATQQTPEPKKPSAGFDVVIIQSNGGALTQIVAGIYTERNGVATLHPADVDEVYMASKRPAALMLKRGDFVRCPVHNVTCVIHYGGEE